MVVNIVESGNVLTIQFGELSSDFLLRDTSFVRQENCKEKSELFFFELGRLIIFDMFPLEVFLYNNMT